MIYNIELVGDYDKELIESIKHEHKEEVEGIYELYDLLYLNGLCDSYCKDRIYYVGYTLAKNNIDFKSKEID